MLFDSQARREKSVDADTGKRLCDGLCIPEPGHQRHVDKNEEIEDMITRSSLDSSSVVVASESQVNCNMDEDVYILRLNDGAYYRLRTKS